MFSGMGAVLAASMTRDLTDRDRAQQITIVGGVMGQSTMGLALTMVMAQQAHTGAAGLGVAVPGIGLAGPTGGVRPGSPVVTTVQVPYLKEGTSETAVDQLTALGLRSTLVRAVSSLPSGTVIGTVPAADSLVGIGSLVSVSVSVGSPVPAVVGRHEDEAVRVVTEAGFRAEVVPVVQAGAKRGRVLGQVPLGGSFLDAEATVVLTVTERSADESETTRETLPRDIPPAGTSGRPRNARRSTPTE